MRSNGPMLRTHLHGAYIRNHPGCCLTFSPVSPLDAAERSRRPRRPDLGVGYPAFLAAVWPVASGLIVGAARWLIKDRMEVTGGRWGLDGAEAVLKLRALRGNGDSMTTSATTSSRKDTATTTAATSRPAISRHYHPKHHPTTGMSYLWKSRTRYDMYRDSLDRRQRYHVDERRPRPHPAHPL